MRVLCLLGCRRGVLEFWCMMLLFGVSVRVFVDVDCEEKLMEKVML